MGFWKRLFGIVSGSGDPADLLRRCQSDEALAHVQQGAVYLKDGECDRAIAEFNKAIRIQPDLPESYCSRGTAYGHKQDWDKAIADQTEALRLNPNYESAYGNRGIAYAQKGEWDKAIADFNEVIRLSPTRALAYFQRGGVYLDKRDWDKAIADFNEAIRLNLDFPALVYLHLGFAYEGMTNLDKAIADYNQALRLDPDLAEARRARDRLGSFLANAKAGPVLEYTLADEPTNPEVRGYSTDDKGNRRPVLRGSIKHKLSSEQLQRVARLREVLADANPPTMDEWVDAFQRDLDPDKEIRLVEASAQVYLDLTAQVSLSPVEKSRLWFVLSCISLKVKGPDLSDIIPANKGLPDLVSLVRMYQEACRNDSRL